MRRSIVLALVLSGCSGANPTTPCPPVQTLSVVGYSTGSAAVVGGLPITSGPYPANATYIYFRADNVQRQPGNPNLPTFVAGMPTLTGGDGSTAMAGPLTSNFATAAGGYYSLFGYSSSVSGLRSSQKYTATFSSLLGDPSGCHYGPQSAGEFSTT